MGLLSSALLKQQDSGMLTEESEENINRLFSFMESWFGDDYKELHNLDLNEFKKNNLQYIQQMYSKYSFTYLQLLGELGGVNGEADYLCFLHNSKGSNEEKCRVIYNDIFPKFANNSEFKFAVDGFFKSELAVARCHDIRTWSGEKGNRSREQIDEKKVENCDGTRYLIQILLITNLEVVIKNYYGIGNVIEISKDKIENCDHNLMGRKVDEIKYLKI